MHIIIILYKVIYRHYNGIFKYPNKNFRTSSAENSCFIFLTYVDLEAWQNH